jgi:uroporphyrinogen-III decarboxylase
VNTYEELEIFRYAVDHLSPQLPAADPEIFLQIDKEIGKDGIATVSLPPTPFMFLIEEVFGVEATYYLLQDHRQEVEDILIKLAASQRRLVGQLATSPAAVIIQYEDTSTTLMSPSIFRRYCLPYLNEYADILHRAGKIFLVHMCGKLRHLVPDIGHGHFDGVTEISPPPTGDLPLDDAAAAFSGKVVVGGIDPTTFIDPDPAAARGAVSALIARIKPHRRILLGSADTMPRGTRVENVRLIRSLVDTAGAYTL